jgi:hypothetical protein
LHCRMLSCCTSVPFLSRVAPYPIMTSNIFSVRLS